MGQLDKIEQSNDGIQYKNFGEDKFQRTERSVRSVAKVFSVQDLSINNDLAEFVDSL